MPMLKKTICFVIMVALVSLTSLPPRGHCDDWLYVESNEDFSVYYKSSSVKIDKQKKTIEVWEKRVFTEKGKHDFLNKFKNIDKQKYSYTLILMVINYIDMKCSIRSIVHYTNSDNILSQGEGQTKWVDITPNSIGDKIVNNILIDYNIQR